MDYSFHNRTNQICFYFKGALSGLRQFFVTEIPLKIMENALYFTVKSIFVLHIFCLDF